MADPTQSVDEQQQQQLRDINEALLASSVRQHELTEQARNAEARLGESEAEAQRQAQFLDATLSALQDHVYVWDLGGRFLYVNPALERLWGLSHRQWHGKTTEELGYLRNQSELFARQRQEVIETRQAITGEVFYTSPTGVSLFAEYVFVPIFGPDATVDRIAGISRDVTDRRRAEAELLESEERFRSFAENSADTLWIANAETGELEYLSPAFESQWGEPREAMMRGSGRWAELIHPEDRERAMQALPRAMAGETLAIEYRIVRPSDGRVCWMRDTGFPIRDEHGRVRRVGGVVQDITEQKHAVEHQRLLLSELQHRVRNTLAVVRSIARRTGETSESVEDFAMHLDGRLNSFARTQAVVTRNPAAGVDLEHMIAEELVSYHAHEGEQVRIDGPPVRLKSKAAETFALAVHELATNAVKYGALASAGGRIAVTWSLDASDNEARLRLEWRESGVGLDGAKLRRKGFGMELLERTLMYELAAKTTLDFRREGLICTIEMPLTERIAVAALSQQPGSPW